MTQKAQEKNTPAAHHLIGKPSTAPTLRQPTFPTRMDAFGTLRFVPSQRQSWVHRPSGVVRFSKTRGSTLFGHRTQRRNRRQRQKWCHPWTFSKCFATGQPQTSRQNLFQKIQRVRQFLQFWQRLFHLGLHIARNTHRGRWRNSRKRPQRWWGYLWTIGTQPASNETRLLGN